MFYPSSTKVTQSQRENLFKKKDNKVIPKSRLAIENSS